MTDLFYWKEIERRARAAHALAMLHNSADTDDINQANAANHRAGTEHGAETR
jgi:hypothetical protein